MKTQSKATAKIIAEQLGLSMATVDRALNNRGNVKQETKIKIMQKAEELNYTPNKLASFLSKKKSHLIGVIFPEYPQYFWEQVEVGIKKALDELSDFGLNVEVLQIDNDEFHRRDDFVREIIHSGKYDALALAAGEDLFIDVIDECIDGGTPICTFNHDSPASKRLFYVGSDYRVSGKLAADLISNFIGEAGSVVLLAKSEDLFQSKEKITGFREVIDQYPNIQIVGPLKFDWREIKSSLYMHKESIASSHAIYAVNAALSDVAEFLEDNGLEDRIKLVGHDMNPKIYQYLNKGVVNAAISQNPETQGYLTVKKLFYYLHGKEKEITQNTYTKLEIVMKENARFYF